MTIQELAEDARPINDADWGSDRQIEAENMFFEYVESLLPVEAWEDLCNYCNKATSDEMIDEALRQLKIVGKAG